MSVITRQKATCTFSPVDAKMYDSNKVASIIINECSVQQHTAEFCRAKSPPLSKMLTTSTSLTLLSIPVALADLHHVCCLRVSVLTFLSRAERSCHPCSACPDATAESSTTSSTTEGARSGNSR